MQDNALYEVVMEEVASIEAQATGVCIGGLIYDRHLARLCAAGNINSLTLLTMSLISYVFISLILAGMVSGRLLEMIPH